MHRDEPATAIEICPPPKARDREGLPGECQYCGRAQRHDHTWMYQLQLPVQPPAIVPDFSRRRLLVDAPFAALLEFEMLDGVGDVHLVPIKSGLRQGPIEQQAGRSDERSALPILLVSGLLPYERNGRPNRPLPQHSTRSAWHEGRGRCDLRVEFVKRLRLRPFRGSFIRRSL